MWIFSWKLVFLVLFISVVLSIRNTIQEIHKVFDPPISFSFKNPRVSLISSDSKPFRGSDTFSFQEIDDISSLEYDYYRQTCPQAEDIVRSTMARIYSQRNDTPPALLRLLFHDCFIEGCDASLLLNESNKNYLNEREAIPNQTLRGFDVIDQIKEALEMACPGVVSCADILVLATRDGLLLAGGPFYPLFTGRRDSSESFFNEAMAEIPQPDDNITKILNSFGRRGFSNREIVALLGGHTIGKIGCQFIHGRLRNFKGTGRPDPTMDPNFANVMRSSCEDSSNRQRVSNASIASGTAFDSHYYQNLLSGRGLLFADQQLMSDSDTASLVTDYASDGGLSFQMIFAKAMIKMSTLGVLSGSRGQIRLNCSLPLASTT